MAWDYRIGYNKRKDAYAIYSVYYEEDEAIYTTSTEPTFIEAESIDELRNDISRILEAFERPILNMSDYIDL